MTSIMLTRWRKVAYLYFHLFSFNLVDLNLGTSQELIRRKQTYVWKTVSAAPVKQLITISPRIMNENETNNIIVNLTKRRNVR